MSRRPVLADVAERAGVSHQTVSRVVNGHPNVRAETRRLVEQAIAELGYRPNATARALVTRRHRRLGVIVGGSGEYGPNRTLLGVDEAARARGYSVSVAMLRAVDPASVADGIRHLLDEGADALVVVTATHHVAEAVAAVPMSVPMVAVDSGTQAGTPRVSVDQSAGARLAVTHLLSLGHPCIEHIAGPSEWHDAIQREAGWREGIAGTGGPVPEPVRGDWSARSGYAAMQQLLARGPVTAVFAANDQMAIGAMRALAEAGRRVPHDVSVVGFDDIPEAAYLSPPLTTIRQDFVDLGQRCVDLLLAVLADDPPPAGVDVPPALVVRESTSPATSTAHKEVQ